MEEEKEGKKKRGKFKRGCLGCLGTGIVLFILIWILWGFLFIRWPIYGKVIDRETGKPIENALVVFAWRNLNYGWKHYDATITDEKGYYKLPARVVFSNPDWGIEMDRRDGYVLVAWFPGYFRDEKWIGKDLRIGAKNWKEGKKLIKGKQDFELQKAKMREEVVRSLENVEIEPSFNFTFYTIENKNIKITQKIIKIENMIFYNSRKFDIIKHYRDITKKLIGVEHAGLY